LHKRFANNELHHHQLQHKKQTKTNHEANVKIQNKVLKKVKCTTIIERKNSHEMISSFNQRNKKYVESFSRDNAFNVSKTLIELHKNSTFNTIRKQKKFIKRALQCHKKKLQTFETTLLTWLIDLQSFTTKTFHVVKNNKSFINGRSQ
jgi:hypothetical protein